MSSLVQLFNPTLRFQRAYAEYLCTRFRYLPLPGTRAALEAEWVMPRGLIDACKRKTRVVITGMPGAGKTTTLTYLATNLARGLLKDPHARLPLFFSAHDSHMLPHIYELPRGLNLSDVLTAQAPRIFFASAFAAGRAVVFIDDADALPTEAWQTALKEFQNATIIASAQTPLPGFAEFRLPGFHDGDIAALAQNLDPQHAGAFLSALKVNNVPRSLTSNPLTLRLLARVWRSDTPLPTRRTDLFGTYVQEILGDADETIKMLKGVALAMRRGRPASNEFLAKGHGFMRAAKNRTVEFAHELWQAYFAACALREATEFAPLRPHLTEPAWRSVILFYAGLGDASELVLNLLSLGDTFLAGDAVAHAHTVRADLHASVTQEMLQRAWDGAGRAVAVLSELNDTAVVDELTTKLKSTDPTIRMRAAEILGQLQMDRGVDCLLPQLRDANGDVRDKVIEALGRAQTDRVIEPLLVALRGDTRAGAPDTRKRVAAAKALGEIASDKALPALIVDLQAGEPALRAAAAAALKRIHSPLMIAPLQGLLQLEDAELRTYAADILSVMNGKE